MITSPSNLIEGLILILKANIGDIDSLIRAYRQEDSLHLFKGVRKTLPLSAFPALEMEPVSGTMEWAHTGAMTGRYAIDCILTVNCGTSVETGVEYICELTRKIVQVFNSPENMTWIIPDEYQDMEKTPVLCQYSDIRNVEYSAAQDSVMRTARWRVCCQVLEHFPQPGRVLGPQRVNWKEDHIPGK